MESIRWPEDYLPGMTDNFASNEVIVEGLSVEDVWALLVNPHRWPEYYANASDIRFSNDNCIWTIGAKTPWMRDALQAAPAAAGFPAA